MTEIGTTGCEVADCITIVYFDEEAPKDNSEGTYLLKVFGPEGQDASEEENQAAIWLTAEEIKNLFFLVSNHEGGL